MAKIVTEENVHGMKVLIRLKGGTKTAQGEIRTVSIKVILVGELHKRDEQTLCHLPDLHGTPKTPDAEKLNLIKDRVFRLASPHSGKSASLRAVADNIDQIPAAIKKAWIAHYEKIQ